jgi:regulator of protease activity HflC (stomatin/prohibitin superfamily)
VNVDDVIRERIEQARIKAEREKRRRAELAEARRHGLAARHAAKLRNLAQALDNQTLSASGA